jgi:hypothetical protein
MLPPARLVYRDVYRSQLGEVRYVNEEEYEVYINCKGKVITTWTGYDSYDDSDDEATLYVEKSLELVAGRLYVTQKREGIRDSYEDFEVVRLIIVPPGEPYPEPASLYHDAEELGLRIQCLYLEELGETKISDWPLELDRGRFVGSWSDDYNIDGRFKNDLFRARRRRRASERELLLERTWMPFWGYCGSGKQIYLITIFGNSETPQLP